MKKNKELTRESFDLLLEWLSPDREAAARKFEEIRQKLINIFYFRGCSDPESLADETINRVTEKKQHLKTELSGDPAKYFYAVANKIYLESFSARNRRFVQLDHQMALKNPFALSDQLPDPETTAAEHECLEKCLEKLSSSDRELILQYFDSDKKDKNQQRQNLAKKWRLSLNSLRVKVHRLKSVLGRCVKKCLETK